MTFEEVKALEKEAGFATESHEEWNYLVAKGTIAGQKDSNVYYFFYDNKSLNWMEYSFEGEIAYFLVGPAISSAFGKRSAVYGGINNSINIAFINCS